jgi:NitT/TauT family transport system substrate-binding protein
VAKLKEMGIITGGGAARSGIGSMEESRIKANYAFLVDNKLIDPAKVPSPAAAYNFTWIKDLKVMP